MKQHTFPSASIARFVNAKGAVQVMRKQSERVFYAKPPDQVFCAQRLWDQQAEGGFMKDIEDAFQSLANVILDDPAFRLDHQHFDVINEFYCLWNIRAQWKKNDRLADPSIGSEQTIRLRHAYTKDEQERLEAAGIGYIRPDLTVSSRSLVSPSIRLNLSDAVRAMSGETWKTLQAVEGSSSCRTTSSNGCSYRCRPPSAFARTLK